MNTKFNDFEIRKPTFISGKIPEEYKYDWDIVKWCNHKPILMTDGRTGEKKMVERSCYSIGFLRWNHKECFYNFESCGMRYFEEREDGLEDFIMDFAIFAKIENNNRGEV